MQRNFSLSLLFFVFLIVVFFAVPFTCLAGDWLVPDDASSDSLIVDVAGGSVYTGEAIQPSVGVSLDGETLAEEAD